MSRFELPVLPDPPGPDSPPDASPGARADADRAVTALAPYVAEGALVAFSGGLDSAFLLWAAHEAVQASGGRVLALTTTSASTPGPDLDDARAFARSLGVEHLCVESGELESEAYLRNDRDRCYWCKAGLFRVAREIAERRGLRFVLYGYTASDHHDVRPGHRAALESGVVAPLSDLGLRKEHLRAVMRERGLQLADKPASPCLSSRITTGVRVTHERLADIQAMETILRRAGVLVYRARVCESADSLFFRIEVDPKEMSKVLECHEELSVEGRRRGYRWVTLDLGGYRTGGGVS